MSWRDKDREEESVDGIAHCDFAKKKEGAICYVLYVFVETLARNIMLR